tara:strand:+ start:3615 stop:4439 length:825 start_codon:yes stop_codon:yes gene_type:complete
VFADFSGFGTSALPNLFRSLSDLMVNVTDPIFGFLRMPDALPGVGLVIFFAGVGCLSRILFVKYRDLNMLIQMGRLFPNSEREFANRYPDFEDEMLKFPVMSRAWFEFCETLVLPNENSKSKIFKNTVRPHVFFNVDRLEIGVQAEKSWPKLFVGLGLLVTLFSLSFAFGEASSARFRDIGAQEALIPQLMVAVSATLYPVMSSVLVYLILTVALRHSEKSITLRLNQLNDKIERGVRFITQEDLSQQSLVLMQKQLEAIQSLNHALTSVKDSE